MRSEIDKGFIDGRRKMKSVSEMEIYGSCEKVIRKKGDGLIIRVRRGMIRSM